MKTYADIKAQMALLEEKAAEIAGVIKRIKEAISVYGLTAQDLGLGGGKAAKGGAPRTQRPAAKGKLVVGLAKYRDPATGKTWTGRGKPPNWIVGVKDRTPYLIDESAAAPAFGARKSDGRKARKSASAPAPGKRARKKSGAGAPAQAPAKSPAGSGESATAQ